MRVRADEATQAYWNYGIVKIAKDEIVEGGLAQYLAETGSPVTVLDDEPELLTAGADMPSPLAVPDGNIEQVLAWVGDDLERAVRALDVENAHKNRKSLIAALERMFETPPPPGPDDNPPSGD